MKKVIYGLMAAAFSLGLAAPSFAASVPAVNTTSHVTKVQQQMAPAKKPAAKKPAAKKAAAKNTAAKKPAAKKPAAKKRAAAAK